MTVVIITLDHSHACMCPPCCRCLYEAWQTSRKGKGRLAILTYGIAFDPLEKVFLELDVAQAQVRAGDNPT